MDKSLDREGGLNRGQEKEGIMIQSGAAGSAENPLPPGRRDFPGPGDIPSLFVDGFIQFLTAVLLFVSLLYRQTPLIALSLLILVVVNGTRLWSRLSLSSLQGLFDLDKIKVFPGEKITIKARVENRGFLPVWAAVRIPAEEKLLPPSEEKQEQKLRGESLLLWKQQVTWQWELTPRRRGCYRVGPAELAAGDPFGFFQRKKILAPAGEIVVFPRLIPLQNPAFQREEFFGLQRARGPVPDPVYPVATRDYLYGHPARHIHWKASARHDRLQEKLFEPSAHLRSLLVVEVTQFAEEGADEGFEAALEGAASLAVKMEERGSPVGFAANGVLAGGGTALLPVARGGDHLSRLLEVLGRLKMEPAGALKDIMHILKEGRHLSRGTFCLCFFLQVDPSLLLLEEILFQGRIPAIFITQRPCRGLSPLRSRIYSLRELLI